MDPETQTLVDLISGVGFPVAVAAYVLIRLDRQIQRVIEKLDTLCAETRANRRSEP